MIVINEEREYAPIVITALHRYEHFARCIESLKRNACAKLTDIYIGIDFPPSERYISGNRKIIEYVEKLEGFKNTFVIKHSQNVGSEKNFFSLRELVLEKYDRYISIEDDNEVSPCFLEFMNDALETYKDDSEVLAVSGYMYPIEEKENVSPASIEKISTYFAATAFGFWAKKEFCMREHLNMHNFEKYYYDFKGMNRLRTDSLNQYCNFVKGMLGYTTDLLKGDKLAQIDLSFGIYMFFEGKTMIYPTISKVRNWGYDGTGEHCKEINSNVKEKGFRSYDFSTQPIDDVDSIGHNLFEINDDMINERLNEFFAIEKNELIRTNMAYFLSRILGLHRTRKLISLIK